MVPDWLGEALANAPRPIGLPWEHGEPIEGDIWVAEADGNRIIVVIAMASGIPVYPGDIVNVNLVDAELDLATSQSLRFDIGEPGIPFSLLVHTDVCGPMLVSDLVRRIGHLPLDHTTIRSAIFLGEWEGLAARRGTGLRGRNDPRWRYIEDLNLMLDPFTGRVVEW